MPRFATRQHDSLRSATGRRHHLNLLLHDHEQENTRIYGDRAPGLLTGTTGRHHSSQNADTQQLREPSQGCSLRYPQQLPSLTQQAMSMSAPIELNSSALDSSSPTAVSPNATCGSTSLMSDSTASEIPASWLTPQQLQSRPQGMKIAKMISSHRTPIGAFANFDLPIAP